MIPYTVAQIEPAAARDFVRTHHYARGSHKAPSLCVGLFATTGMIGCIIFATPCSEAVRASVFGQQHKEKVTELHRLVIVDGTPKNTESWFIARALSLLREVKPCIKAVVSFSDETEGHVGTIYQATNALYYGRSSRATFYRDEHGTLRHPRQCGVNITPEEAQHRGWTAVKRLPKHRYCWILANNKGERNQLLSMLKLVQHPYPKLTAGESYQLRLASSLDQL